MVDEAKLQQLRERYLGARGGEMYDPHFRSVAELQFSGERRKWPFASSAISGQFLIFSQRPDCPSFYPYARAIQHWT